MDKEEGEMSDDNMVIEDSTEVNNVEQDSDQVLLFKADRNGIVFEQLEKLDAAKLEERAKRFGLNLSGNRVVTQTQIDELYNKSGIQSGNERHFRFNTLHMNGIEELTTREIFEYLEDYKPVSLEKIDDVSCNVVCQDHISAALALLVHSREIKDEQLKELLREKSEHHWREGMPHPKKDLILMRFATNADKKMAKVKPDKKLPDEYYDSSMDPVSKNPWGDLCKSWGVYDHQEVFQRKLPKNDYEDEIEEPQRPLEIRNKRLAMRLGKRRQKPEVSDDSNSDSEWKMKSKTPRMRMRADDEESKKKKTQIKKESSEDEDDYEEKDKYAPLSIEVVNSRSDYAPKETTKLSDKFRSHNKMLANKKGSIQSRLGVKVAPADDHLTDGSSSVDSDDYNISSKVQKVKSTARSNPAPSVWSRLECKSQEEKSSQSDLRQILKSRKQKNSDDLRDRLGKTKKTNLRIEIDNN